MRPHERRLGELLVEMGLCPVEAKLHPGRHEYTRGHPREGGAWVGAGESAPDTFLGTRPISKQVGLGDRRLAVFLIRDLFIQKLGG